MPYQDFTCVLVSLVGYSLSLLWGELQKSSPTQTRETVPHGLFICEKKEWCKNSGREFFQVLNILDITLNEFSSRGWDDLYDFDTCCLGVSKTLQSFKSVFGPLLRVLCCGCTLAPLILLGWGLGNIQTLSRIWTTQTYTLYGFRAIYPRGGEMGS